MTRAELIAQYRVLLDEGLTIAEIAECSGKAYSSVANLLADPDGSMQRERRKRYQGKCVDCGRATEGSGGYKNQRVRCARCSHAYQQAHRHWTRERIITAIQEWAAIHGRPPTSTEWHSAGKDHPAMSNVYRTKSARHNPFASWSEAIEAAGFPRPRVGHYERTEETLRRQSEARITWSREVILERIREWADAHGSPPTSTAWRRTNRGGNYWPSLFTVSRRFETWNAAIREAGFEPRPRGWQKK